MTTDNKVEDLTRWLTTPNARHADGKRVERQREVEFIGSDRFTNQHLQEALIYGIDIIKKTRVDIHSLAAYFEGRYNLFFRDLMRDAINVNRFPTATQIAQLSRPDLIYEMVRTATQFDYLKEEIEKLNKGIVRTKWDLARKGDDFEIRELLRLGYVELEQETNKDEGVLRLG